jgi:hypothetical protein
MKLLFRQYNLWQKNVRVFDCDSNSISFMIKVQSNRTVFLVNNTEWLFLKNDKVLIENEIIDKLGYERGWNISPVPYIKAEQDVFNAKEVSINFFLKKYMVLKGIDEVVQIIITQHFLHFYTSTDIDIYLKDYLWVMLLFSILLNEDRSIGG